MNELYTTTEIVEASEDNLPQEIEVLQENAWKNMPGRPDFSVSATDLDEYVDNFKSKKRAGVPIDIEHGKDPTFGNQAAGWISDMMVKTKENGKKALFVKPDWNGLGSKLVGDKRFKFVSADFIPASLGGIQDKEGKGLLKNVIRKITITNTPLMKDLPAIMASEDAESTSGLTYQVSPAIIKSNEGAEQVNLEAIRAKSAADLSAEEKTFATEHKADFSAAEQVKLGLAEAPKPDVSATEGDEKVTLTKAEYTELKTKADSATGLVERMTKLEGAVTAGVKASEELANTKAEAVVDSHIKRGAIKQDARESWTKQLVQASEDNRKELETMLTGLPSNEILASEKGDGTPGEAGAGAIKLLNVETDKIMDASKGADGKPTKDYTAAMLEARAANSVLASEADAEAANGERVVA